VLVYPLIVLLKHILAIAVCSKGMFSFYAASCISCFRWSSLFFPLCFLENDSSACILCSVVFDPFRLLLSGRVVELAQAEADLYASYVLKD